MGGRLFRGDVMMGRLVLVVAFSILMATTLAAQYPPGQQSSSNVRVVSHIPMAVADIEVEQELSRPYAYLARRDPATGVGTDIIDVTDLSRARVIFSWRIENPELHQGSALDNKYFKTGGRYYDVQSFQFRQSGPDTDLGAIVLDVTSLPDTAGIREAGRIRVPDTPGGFHNIFTYKHSDGRVLLLTTATASHANVYDMEKFLAGDADYGRIGRIPQPTSDPYGKAPAVNALNKLLTRALPGYHDIYVGYDPATRQDKFYGPGAAGYYVYDITRPEEPRLLTSITGVAGAPFGHTFTPDPTGRYAVTEVEYQYAPLRIFDLKPGLDGRVETISRPIGAWTANWKNLAHNHEVRWPYVFVSGYKDGLQVFNMMDPTAPYTVGYYDTYDAPDGFGHERAGVLGAMGGTFGVDVRNADGLIVLSDSRTGFWAFFMDGFEGWNGHQWGMPNISSVQDWDNGPDGAPAPTQVSVWRP